MANLTVATTPLVSLLRELRDETKALFKQEVQLAKTELSEKFSHVGKNAVSLAIGGFVAYAGLIVLLVGLGALIGWGLEKAGLHPMLAAFIGLAATGLLIALVGYLFIAKALKSFKREPVAPQRTVHTLQHLAGTQPQRAPAQPKAEPEHKESSKDLENRVNVTQSMVGERMEELSRRMRPEYVDAVVKGQVRTHPMRSVAVAFGTGLASAFLVTRRFRHARA